MAQLYPSSRTRNRAGHRPALTLSPNDYNAKTGLALFCPITSRIKKYPFEVLLPSSGSVIGVVLSDQVKKPRLGVHDRPVYEAKGLATGCCRSPGEK